MHQDYRKMPGSPNCIDADDLSCNAKIRGDVQWLIGFALKAAGKRGSAPSKAKRLQCTAASSREANRRDAEAPRCPAVDAVPAFEDDLLVE